VRPLPWLLRMSLFVIGFAVGLSRDGVSTVEQPVQPVVIELQIVVPDRPVKPVVAAQASDPSWLPLESARNRP
jgi:hypothetical protein